MSANTAPTAKFISAYLHERELLVVANSGTTWPYWVRVIYSTAPDREERRYFLAVAESGPGVWDAVDAAYRLGGKDAVCGLVEGLLAQGDEYEKYYGQDQSAYSRLGT